LWQWTNITTVVLTKTSGNKKTPSPGWRWKHIRTPPDKARPFGSMATEE
jgi:hypothetical protein